MGKKKQPPSLSTKFDLRSELRAQPGVKLDELDPGRTPFYPGKGKKDADKRILKIGPELSDLQEMLFAAGRANPESAKRLLVVLQGMDTAGKGGVVRHVFGLVDPQGLQLKAFKKPTKEELSHHFLWRIKKALPGPGMIGIFDRSHYEDVLVVRVDSLVPEEEWEGRYDEINKFEQGLVDDGYTIVKCMLHISSEVQKERLLRRLDRDDKHWKYNPGDVDVRNKWPQYREAYEAVLERTNPDHAPWYVIPSDHKWYRNWAIARIMLEHLREFDLEWPKADFDLAAEIERVENSLS